MAVLFDTMCLLNSLIVISKSIGDSNAEIINGDMQTDPPQNSAVSSNDEGEFKLTLSLMR